MAKKRGAKGQRGQPAKPAESAQETSTKKPGRPAKPPSELHTIQVTLKFVDEQAQIIELAAARKFESRAVYLRRAALETAYRELGLKLPEPPKK